MTRRRFLRAFTAVQIAAYAVAIYGVWEFHLNAVADADAYYMGAARYERPRPPPLDSLKAFIGATSYGANTLQQCAGLPMKVHKVDPATYDGYSDATNGIQDILRNQLHDDTLNIVLFTESGMVDVWDSDGGADRYLLEISNSCVIVSGIMAQGDGPPVLRAPFDDRFVQLRINTGPSQIHSVLISDVRLWSDSSSSSTPAYAVRHVNDYVMAYSEIIGGPDQAGIRPAGVETGVWLGDITHQHNVFGPVNDWPSSSTHFLITYKMAQGDSLTRIGHVKNLHVDGTYRIPKVSVSTTSEDSADKADDWELLNNISVSIGSQPRSMGTQGAFTGDFMGNLVIYGLGESIGTGYQPIEYRRCDSALDTGLEWAIGGGLYMLGNLYRKAGVDDATDYGMVYGEDTAPYDFNCGRGHQSTFPDSLKKAQRNQHPDTLTITPVADLEDELFDGTLHEQVGPRKISCSGTLQNARNSVVQKLINYAENDTYLGASYQDSLDAGWGWLTRDTLIGSAACPDVDDDGIPDAAEKVVMGVSDSTGLAPDDTSPASGYPAIRLLLMGRISEFGEGGGGGPPGPSAGTYADGRRVYLVPYDQETDTLGTPPDTQIVVRRVPNRDSVPLGYAYTVLLVSGRDSVLLITYDSLGEIGAGWRDSAAVDSIASDWGISYPPYPWSMSTPGAP